MAKVAKIYTDGYSGPLTGFHFLPPGEYTIGDEVSVVARTVTEELARYMVSIGKAVGRADFETPDANSEDTHDVATKTVTVNDDGEIDVRKRTAKRRRGRRTQ